MEKFEFFPIKCRIQRTTEAFSISRSDVNEDTEWISISSKVFGVYTIKIVRKSKQGRFVAFIHALALMRAVSLLLIILSFLWQTIFFWALLVRHIMQYYDENPELRPKPPPQMMTQHKNQVQLTPKEQAQIQEIFDLFDTDGGKTIDAKELDAAMFALGFQPQDHNKWEGLAQLRGSRDSRRNPGELSMGQIDLDGSNTVTIEEFTLLMKGELTGRGPLEEIWAAFSVLSRADTVLTPGWTAPGVSQTQSGHEDWGRVTLDGLRRACREFDVRLTEAELTMMMGEVDSDGDGSIDREEFMRIMDRAPWF